jgi:hypothetical protein
MARKITKHIGKGSSSQVLPNRSVLNSLSKGDPADRSISNYAKAAPSIVQNGPNITGQDPTE